MSPVSLFEPALKCSFTFCGNGCRTLTRAKMASKCTSVICSITEMQPKLLKENEGSYSPHNSPFSFDDFFYLAEFPFHKKIMKMVGVITYLTCHSPLSFHSFLVPFPAFYLSPQILAVRRTVDSQR